MGNLISSFLALAAGLLLAFIAVSSVPSYRFRGSWMDPISPSRTLELFLSNDWPNKKAIEAVELEKRLKERREDYKYFQEKDSTDKSFFIFQLILPAIAFYCLFHPVRILSELIPFLVGYLSFTHLLRRQGVQSFTEKEIPEPLPRPATYESVDEFFSYWNHEELRTREAFLQRADELKRMVDRAKKYKLALVIISIAAACSLFL